MKKKEFKGATTDEQIAAWKTQHGEVFEVKVGDSVCYLKKPDRQTLKAVLSAAVSDEIRANEITLENCWLFGDETIKSDNDKFISISASLSQLVEIKEVELKKL